LRRYGIAAENIVVAGDSTGGNLTITLIIRLREAPLTLIQVGSTETLLADATRLAAALGEADVDVTLEIWPHMIQAGPLWDAKLSDGRHALVRAGTTLPRVCAK
jgi:monoterpene epsilon-lactone hydrolase